MGRNGGNAKRMIQLAFGAAIPASVGLMWSMAHMHPPTKWQPLPPPGSRVEIGQVIELPTAIRRMRDGRPLWIHVYGATCPCSRRVLSATMAFERRLADQVQVIALNVGSPSDVIEDRLLGLRWRGPVLADPDGSLAKSLGVVSTPQAVIVLPDDRVAFRGNYGRRGDHSSQSQFEEAISAVLAGRQAPQGAEGLGCSVTPEES